MRRVAAKFVQKLLNCDQSQHRMNIANEMLDSVRDDPNLLQRVITGDEAWVYGYDVETIAQSSQWKLPHEPRPKKARQVRSNVKVLLTVFFDCRGAVHHEFLPQGRTVNKEYYLQVMRNLREAIRQKRPDLWKNKNWLLHHDNAPAHTSLLVRDLLVKNNTLMMPQPPYSPELAPCDFFLFPKLKRPMKGRRYATLDEIKTASKEELKNIFKNDFLKCFEDWKNRWHKYMAESMMMEGVLLWRGDRSWAGLVLDDVCGSRNQRERERRARHTGRPFVSPTITNCLNSPEVPSNGAPVVAPWNVAAVSTEWNEIVFTDESRFCLQHHDGRTRVWRHRGERMLNSCVMHRHTGPSPGIMVWGCIGYHSRTPLVRISGTLNSQRYISDVLEPVVLPYLQGLPTDIFQQDNARSHVARIVQRLRASAASVVRLPSSVVYLYLLELPSRPASVSCCLHAGIPSRIHDHDCPSGRGRVEDLGTYKSQARSVDQKRSLYTGNALTSSRARLGFYI
ncbi:hypothetical protein LAZ67_19001543 [Cordylochernes scorpioides]|uniref:Transposase n=1 Tax=Cordylochernes scorpioides TaxID=51811 RepID=A0ABY6LIR1_9ARAC|nr:hypothetical protein LAZ67_19001543 [Cordylochernes scorpioides]